MNFLNLQHLGEVDEVQQLKKEHFDIKAREVLAQSSSASIVSSGAPRSKFGSSKKYRATYTGMIEVNVPRI